MQGLEAAIEQVETTITQLQSIIGVREREVRKLHAQGNHGGAYRVGLDIVRCKNKLVESISLRDVLLDVSKRIEGTPLQLS